MAKEKIRRKVLKPTPQRKSLPGGNLEAVGRNLALGRAMERSRRPNVRVPMGDGMGGVEYDMPIHAQTSIHAREQLAGRRPGTGRPGFGWWLPPEGPPIELR